MAMYGGIEGGGTKFICAIGSSPDEIVAEVSFATTDDVKATLGKAIEFFRQYSREKPLEAIGIASFGPVDPDPRSLHYGYITTTPKPGWAWTNFVGPVQDALGLPVA